MFLSSKVTVQKLSSSVRSIGLGTDMASGGRGDVDTELGRLDTDFIKHMREVSSMIGSTQGNFQMDLQWVPTVCLSSCEHDFSSLTLS